MWSFRKRKQRERDLDDEIAHDLALDAAERMRDGATPEDAARTSRRDFGNIALVKEGTRSTWGWMWFEILLQDLRYALRTLSHSPGFLATAILALALGIGVNTACFTIFDQIVFRPLPIPDGDRIVSVSESFRGRFSRSMHGNLHMLSYPELAFYADHNRVFTDIAAYAPAKGLALAGTPPETLFGYFVTGNYFRMLSARAAAGRLLLPDDSFAPNAVVLLSYPCWQRRFGGDPAIVGATIRLNQTPLTVVGVASADFLGTGAALPDLWMPLAMQPELLPGVSPEPRDFRQAESFSWLNTVARLKPGVSARQAQADLAVLAAQLDRNFPGQITSVSVDAGALAGNPEARAVILFAGVAILLVVALVLLVACANVANLLLARAASRQREIAVRLSMGASRSRVIRQLLTESAMIALAGGALGLLLARWSLKIGYTLLAAKASLPRFALTLDANVLLYTAILSAAACLMFGLLPALQATSADLSSALKDEGALWGRRVSKARLRSALVALEVAISMALLLSTGLLVRGVWNVQSRSDRLRLDTFLVTTIDLRAHKYDPARAAAFQEQLRASLDRVPGASSALTILPPFSGVGITAVRLEGQSAEAPDPVNFYTVSAAYFDTMSLRPARGRTFTAAEEARGGVAVISGAMARRFWPGADPIGRRFAFGANNLSNLVQVIGVVKDSRTIHLWEEDGPVFYTPIGSKNASYLSVLTRVPKPDFLPPSAVQQLVRQLDPTVNASTHTLADNVEHEAQPARVGAAVAAVLGALALLLALAGIYCVVTYSVSQRTREIGIRMTLGAERRSVIALMLADHMRPVFAGMIGGALFGAGISAAASKALQGISPLEPVAFLAVAVFLVAVTLLASYIPARRATKVDPAIALRYE